MKKIILAFFISSCYLQSSSQDTTVAGKVIYDYTTHTNGKTVLKPLLFLFQSDRYAHVFITTGNSNDALLKDLKRKRAENPGDSLKYAEIERTIREQDDITKPQPLFGTLRTNFTLSKWIEPYTKKQYCIRDNVPPISWELADDTATISGLFCQKATGSSIGNKYEAWFAPSIPVSVAPFQLRGLPGLLVEMTNLTNKSHLKLVELYWPYKEGFPSSNCDPSTAITRQEKDAIFAIEDAKARKQADDIRKAYEQQQKAKQE
jgi:GLPGLI family protein